MTYLDFDLVYWGMAGNLMSTNWVDYCSGDSGYFDSKAVQLIMSACTLSRIGCTWCLVRLKSVHWEFSAKYLWSRSSVPSSFTQTKDRRTLSSMLIRFIVMNNVDHRSMRYRNIVSRPRSILNPGIFRISRLNLWL